jgi:biotin/methionine sulfoxide reductase
MHPGVASERGIIDGSLVRVFNDRGAFLAVARVCEDMHPCVVQIATGAWLDLRRDGDGVAMCVHGNPNIVTFDAGTSRLGQGTTGQLWVVQVERYERDAPDVTAYEPPF